MMRHIIIISIFVSLIGLNGLYASEQNIHIHGFISQGYLRSDKCSYLADSEDGTFEFNEMGINFVTMVNKNLRIGTQFFARDLGKYGNDEIELDWGYADYRVNNFIGLRVGKFKVVSGLYNEVRDMDTVRPTIMLPPSIYEEMNRDIVSSMKGVGIYGELPFGISYQMAIGNNSLPPTSRLWIDIRDVVVSDIKAGYGILYGPSEADKITGGVTDARVSNTYNAAVSINIPKISGLRMSATSYGGDGKMEMQLNFPTGTADLKLEVDRVMMTVYSLEYIYMNTIVAFETKSIVITIEDVDRWLDGWALSMSQRINNWLEIGGYYANFNSNRDDKKGKLYDLQGLPRYKRWLKDSCLAVRFDINANWIFKLEGHYMDGIQNVDLETSEDISQYWYLFAAKLSYHF